MSFPQDRYTPHGYLDLPNHARRLHPLGVLRSEGVGFHWHFPALAGGYGGRWVQYVAGFRISLAGALDMGDFDEVYCPYHSKNLFQFELRKKRASARAVFHPIGDHTLRCRLELSGKGRARLGVHVQYHRLLGATGEWGESGLVGRQEGDLLILQGYESGESFVLHSSVPPDDWGLSADPTAARQWKDQPAPGIAAPLTVTGKSGEARVLYATLGFEVDLGEEPQTWEMLMSRGLTVPRAKAELRRAEAQAGREEDRLRTSDARFWETAPRLEGDWPEHWRRGMVYDLETVRMMLKPPVGIYHYFWDAMQIQSPRVVLAETAMDALLLSYADPTIARQVILGIFADTPEPNVPCSREDGSYNMVSAEGIACGTAPSWGYPWLAIAHLVALDPDRFWLEQLYPSLVEYLHWWLAHRRTERGWLVHACSWESGQDGSARFGEQPLGEGGPAWHVWPVDLQAAFAHAAQVMAALAETLGRTKEKAKWTALEAAFKARTERLWDGRRYADFDTRVGRLTDVDDVMLLSPAALGIANPERVVALRPAIEALDADRLTWPMWAWTATEAALNAGLFEKAADLAEAVCERVYSFWDAPEAQPDRTLPGVACEYWPPDGRCGGEGYGWGAFSTHLVLHVLVGLSLSPTHLLLRPNLPPGWRTPGRHYQLHWHGRGQPIEITLEPLRGEQVRVTVNDHATETAWGEQLEYRWEELG